MNTLSPNSPIWDIIICPGCGATMDKHELSKLMITNLSSGECYNCGYEDAHGRLQSLGEILNNGDAQYNHVNLYRFLLSLMEQMGISLDEN